MIPQVVTSELAAESDAYSYSQIIDFALSRGDAWFYVWSKTAHADGVPWPNTTMFADEMNNVTFHQQMMAFSGRLYELFNRQTGQYPVDAVFTSRAGLVPQLMGGLATHPDKPVPVVTLEPRVYGEGAIAHHDVTELDAAVRAMGYALGIKVFWSEFEQDEALRTVGQWLSPGAVDRAEKTSFIVPQLVDPPDVQTRPTDRHRLMFVGRLNPNKQWPKVLEAYGKVLMTRNDTEVWLHAGTGAIKKLDPADSRWFKTTEKIASHDEYLRTLAGTDVSVYASRDEGVNVTVLELLALGVVMLLPDRPWVRKLFHPMEYPFVWSDWKSLPAYIDYALDNKETMKAKLAPIRAMIKKRYGKRSWEDAWGRVFSEIEEWNIRNGLDEIRNLRRDAEQLLAPFKNMSLQTLIMASPIMKQPPWKKRLFSTYAAYLTVREFDDYSQALPYLKGRGDA